MIPEKIDPLDLLYTRAFEMALRIDAGFVQFSLGVDLLLDAATSAGLVDRYGDDVIQHVFGQAFTDAACGVRPEIDISTSENSGAK